RVLLARGVVRPRRVRLGADPALRQAAGRHDRVPRADRRPARRPRLARPGSLRVAVRRLDAAARRAARRDDLGAAPLPALAAPRAATRGPLLRLLPRAQRLVLVPRD